MENINYFHKIAANGQCVTISNIICLFRWNVYFYLFPSLFIIIYKFETIKTNYKSLNVQSLRQIAEDQGLIEKGEKKNKKELMELLQ